MRPRVYCIALLVGFSAVCFVAVPLASPTAAYASCPDNQDKGFWISSSLDSQSHGEQADAKIVSEAWADCTPAPLEQWLAAEGTTYMAPGGYATGNWAEIGWQQEWLKIEQFHLFTEWGVNWKTTSNGGNENEFSSGCAVNGGVVTLRVTSIGSGEWALAYACNGGGFTTYDHSSNLGYNYGRPHLELSHHSLGGSPTYTETFTNVKNKNSNDVWVDGFGNFGCSSDTAIGAWNAQGTDSSGQARSMHITNNAAGIC